MKQYPALFFSRAQAYRILIPLIAVLVLLSLSDLEFIRNQIPADWEVVIMSVKRGIFIGTVALASWSLGVRESLAVFAIDLAVLTRHHFFSLSSSPVVSSDVEFFIVILLAGGVLWIVNYARSSTTQLRITEQNVRNSLENSNVGICIVSYSGRLVYANNAYLQLWGYDSLEQLKRVPLSRRYTAKSYTEFQDRKLVFASEQTMPACFELDIVRRDGEIRNLIASYNNVVWDTQSHLIVTYQDITTGKQAEAERRLMQEKAQVASRLAAIGEIAAGLTHEINNPLTAVIGFADLVLQKDIPEDIREDVALISESGHRVADIVKRLLAFARHSRTIREITDLNATIESTIKLQHYALRNRNIEVETRLSPDLPATSVDPIQMQQVFLNLIVNAEQALKDCARPKKITVESRYTDEGFIEISFRDNGPGIAHEHLSKLFMPFFTTKPAGEGTGLGLSLSKNIITQHGGSLTCESTAGTGAAFTIRLPITGTPEAPTDEPDGADRRETPSGNILVVDDEELVRTFITRTLGESHSVDTCTSTTEALALVERAGYDAIFLDMRMPDHDGIELYSVLKERYPRLCRRVIFVTGDRLSPDIREFFESNRLPYLLKPFTADELKRTLGALSAGNRSGVEPEPVRF